MLDKSSKVFVQIIVDNSMKNVSLLTYMINSIQQALVIHHFRWERLSLTEAQLKSELKYFRNGKI